MHYLNNMQKLHDSEEGEDNLDQHVDEAPSRAVPELAFGFHAPESTINLQSASVAKGWPPS